MFVSIGRLLKKIDDLRSAAEEATVFAEKLNSVEARRGILELADEWETQATAEEDRLLRSLEAEP